jgi:hypothetical protein
MSRDAVKPESDACGEERPRSSGNTTRTEIVGIDEGDQPDRLFDPAALGNP